MNTVDPVIVLPLQKHRVNPALSESPVLRYFTFAALYLAQGIPEGLTFFAIPAWMAMNGKTPAEIGSFAAVVIIPWTFKIVVAPLMDRFSFLSMGRRRPWVLFGQLGLVLTFFSMAFISDPLNHLPALMFAGFWVSFFGAFQDIAVDGMAIDIIPPNQQARANGIMWGSKTAGISVSLAVGSWFINSYGFAYAVVALSSVVLLIMLIPLFIKERTGEKLLPWTQGEASEHSKNIQLESWKHIFESLRKVMFLKSSLLMAFAIFGCGFTFNLMNTLLPVFTIQEIGWTDISYSQITATANITGGLLGMMIGGILVDHFGKKRMIHTYLLLLILLVSVVCFQREFWHSKTFIAGFIILYYLLYTFITIAVFAICMQLCWKRVAATQFTLFMTIHNIGYALGARSLGSLKSMLEWQFVLFVIAIIAAVIIAITWFIKLDAHVIKVEELEKNYF